MSHLKINLLRIILFILVLALTISIGNMKTIAENLNNEVQIEQFYKPQQIFNESIGDRTSGQECTPLDKNYLNNIKPKTFTTDDGKKGWYVKIPEGLPLATPAYGDGMIFIGGGFGSYSFYALNAGSGEIAWGVHTGDDGPTAAVIEDGIVVFNTESCIIYALRAEDGKDLWHHWLGDPLMSQPAIYDGKVYMAYPGGGSHILICLDLYDGETYWKTPIVSDIISAPVVDNDEVYLASFDGMVYCYSADTGKELWRENYNATSAPWIFEGELFTSLRENEQIIDEQGNKVEQRYEGVGILDGKSGRRVNEKLHNRQEANYLKAERSSKWAKEQMAHDSSVGFGSAPSTAKSTPTVVLADTSKSPSTCVSFLRLIFEYVPWPT